MSGSLQGLETLLWVSRLGSFTSAATRMNRSQAAISMRIKELEADLGVALLERSTKGLRLTRAGRTCVKYAQRMVALNAELQHQISTADALVGTVRLGVSEAIAMTWLPNLIKLLGIRYPQIRAELNVDVTSGLWDRFSRGELDCILMSGPVPRAEVVADFLGELEFLWMASPLLGLAEGALTPERIGRLPIVTLSQGANLYEWIHDWFAGGRVRPTKFVLCNSLGVVVALARSGAGVALLPEVLVQREVRDRALLTLHANRTPLQVKYYCIYPAYRSSAASKVISALARESSTFAFKDPH